jgi:hypothetical protein
MEEKIYSRAAAKSSLSDLVIDQKHPERSFTRREMDLLQQNDTWVQCRFIVLSVHARRCTMSLTLLSFSLSCNNRRRMLRL